VTVEVRNPSRRSEIVGEFTPATPDDVDAALAAAARAQPAWAATSIAERVVALLRVADAIDARAEELGMLLAREAGIPIGEARGEARIAAAGFRNAAGFADELLTPAEFPAGDGFVRVGHRPIGVVVGIVPWNAPLALAAQKLAPALAAGNAIVLKPSPVAPLAVSALVRLVAAQLPEGLAGLVVGDGDVGVRLIEDPRVRKISFTGGGATARAIMRSAATSLTKIHFELGGNDAAIVLDDADLGMTAERLAQTAFRRAGQVCYAVKRVYLPQSRAAEFTEALVAAVDALTVGDAIDERAAMGPVVNAAQFASVTALGDAATASGRRVLNLGDVLDEPGWGGGWFLRPRVVTDAEQHDPLVQTEQFGPILPLVGYASDDDAVALANDTEYGLGSSVWSADRERALAVAGRLDAGLTFVNHHRLSMTGFRHIPFGGVKQSGMGWENSPAGLAEYLNFHSIDVHPTE
jgi:acyl-CoA reductase-like NAD-dependent aldehyde dehydrogenase